MLFSKMPGEYQDTSDAQFDQQQTLGDGEHHETSNVGEEHRASIDRYSRVEWESDLKRYPSVGDGRVEIQRIAFVLEKSLARVTTIEGNEDVSLLLDILVKSGIEAPQVGWLLYNRQGAIALHTNNDICGSPLQPLKKGQRLIAEFDFRLPGLANGNYIFSVGLQDHAEMPHKIDDVYEFSVSRSDSKGSQCGYVVLQKERFESVLVDQ
jgi:hypothetical protein